MRDSALRASLMSVFFLSHFLSHSRVLCEIFMLFQDDLNLWLPNVKNPPTDLDLEMARFMLAQVGDQFCDLLTQEAEAINIHMSEGKLSKKIKRDEKTVVETLAR